MPDDRLNAARPWRHRLSWIAAAAALGLLLWQGHHIAHLLPRIEAWVDSLGPWAPLAYAAGVIVLSPLLVPDSIFAIVAGVVFGLAEGFALYFGAVYVGSLIATGLGRRWLRTRVLAVLETRPDLDAMVRAARSEGAWVTFWIRLIPLNPAIVSYALGAAGVPLRSVALGTLGMFPHMLLAVYLGVAAAHVTRMAGESHESWTLQGASLLLGLVACAGVVAWVSRLAARQVAAAEREARRDGAVGMPDR